jgi:threonylcarbamoyladenosine tRNA methylthiotransferase MtaB
MKVSVLTLGCKVNQSESSTIKGSLELNGASIVNISEMPDVCIVNTCTVTSKSDYNSRQLIRRAVKTGARVIVTGCYAQLKKNKILEIPGISEVVDISRKFEIVSSITGSNSLVFSSFTRSRPFLKVQDGCNFRCAYCSVPFARGRSTSISLSEAIERVQDIEAAGYNEVVLTGVHLGCYGLDLPEKSSLKILIRNVLKHSQIKRIRLSSLEVNEIDDELIELLQDMRLCSHLHIPLQSGSDKILKSMRRNYSSSAFRATLSKIFSEIDNIAIGSDVIVGFPGESDQDFAATHSLLLAFPFSYFHVFPFSARPGTEANSMGERVQSKVMKDRLNRLLALSKEKKRAYLQKQIMNVLDVLIEARSTGETNEGTSGNYLKVAIPSCNAEARSIVLAKITGVSGDQLQASVVP